MSNSRYCGSVWLAGVVGVAALLAGGCGSDDQGGSGSSPSAPSDGAVSTAVGVSTTDSASTEATVPSTTASSTVPASLVPESRPTVVLVHGAFATAGSWAPVASALEEVGYSVEVPELTLQGLAGDVATVNAVLDGIDEPVVLVGHSYGGIVITNAATGRDDVSALVYIAGFAPDEGESISSLQAEFPGSRVGPDTISFAPYTRTDGSEATAVSILPDVFGEVFAADLPPEVAAQAAADQRPLDAVALSEPSGSPAWREIASWFLVATADQVIPPDASRWMAQRAGSTVTEVDASHAVLVSQPGAVVEVIETAAAG